jgi:hypothetical protein
MLGTWNWWSWPGTFGLASYIRVIEPPQLTTSILLQPPTDRYVASKLYGIPVSIVLNCGIELWRNLEIDDDELLEIAIRDISYQIQLQKIREEGGETEYSHIGSVDTSRYVDSPSTAKTSPDRKSDSYQAFDSVRRRFNPRVDPTGMAMTCVRVL